MYTSEYPKLNPLGQIPCVERTCVMIDMPTGLCEFSAHCRRRRCGNSVRRGNAEHTEGAVKFWNQVQPQVQISYIFVFTNLFLYRNLYYGLQLQMFFNTKKPSVYRIVYKPSRNRPSCRRMKGFCGRNLNR